MPVLVRAVHVDDLAEGSSRRVRVHGTDLRLLRVGGSWHAFLARDARMPERVGAADLVWARQKGAREIRVVVRGSWVHVERDAEAPPAPSAS